MDQKTDEAVCWRCTECHKPDLCGGIKQQTKTRGVAGRCYWCKKKVDAYFGKSRKIANLQGVKN